MRVFITGSTGFVGAHIARRLVERGDEVIALVRPTSNLRLLQPMLRGLQHPKEPSRDSTPLGGEPPCGEPPCGEPPCGEPLGGEPMGGEPLGGDFRIATSELEGRDSEIPAQGPCGEPPCGEPPCGEPMGGDFRIATSELECRDSEIPAQGTIAAVTGDLTDPATYAHHLDGIDQLYHVAADYRLWARDPGEIYRSNVEGTRAILQAAMERGVGRVVYTSTVGCLGIPKDGSPGDETTPVTRDELVGHYKKSKYDAEQVALDYAERGLDVVIANPSTPVGPGDIKPTPTGKIILDFLRGRMPAYVDTGMNLVAVEDVAEGHLLAAEKGRAGEKYILGNRNLTLREILTILATITNRKPPRFRIPIAIAVAAALIDSARSRLTASEPNIPLDGVLMARKKMYFSPAKAVRELGLPQTPVEDALERAVRWFEENGYVK